MAGNTAAVFIRTNRWNARKISFDQKGNEKMRIVFLSNFFNHHQSALSDALWTQTGGKYSFVETSTMPQSRKALGYHVEQKPYVLRYQGNEEQVLKLIREADVVLVGSTPEKLVRQRIRTGKLMFRYAEHPLKKGLEPWKYLPRLVRWHWRNPMRKPIYMLCASAYTAGDYAKFGLFLDRTYKWGYFPETRWYENLEALWAEKDVAELLWCGRFLDWKHPDDAIMVARWLKNDGYAFRLNFIGRGEMEDAVRQMVQEYQLEDCVRFLGSMKPEEVREHMERAGIYLFTSDRQEGWGAVLNESMNSGCAVVASHAIGSVPFLIRDGENGLIYESENVDMLYEKIKYLLNHPEKQKRLGMEAYETITTEWNAETAVERLMKLAAEISKRECKPLPFEEGPCSIAEIRKES